MICHCSMLVTLHKIGEMYLRLLGMNDFPVKTENEKLSAAGLRCRKFRLADYDKTLHEKARHTCSTIIFPRSTNRIIYLWRCRFLKSLIARYDTTRQKDIMYISWLEGIMQIRCWMERKRSFKIVLRSKNDQFQCTNFFLRKNEQFLLIANYNNDKIAPFKILKMRESGF